MNNLELTYSPYNLKLKSAFETAHGKIDKRRGFIISIRNSSGLEGLGDTAPFPEIGSELLEEAEQELKCIKLDLKIELTNIRENFNELLGDYYLLPSLRHGIEQALFNLICKEKKITIDKLLKLSLAKNINVNASIGFLPEDETIKKANTLIESGIKTLKIKFGRDNFEADYQCIKALKDEFGNEINLRIDANGKWNLKSAIKNLKRLEKFNPQYAEQPVNSIDDFVKLKNEISIPLAADESIRTKKAAEDFINKNAVDYLILKPMIIGGLLPTLEIIELAEKNNITPVITSSFESAIGKANAVIAAATVKKDTAHGLALNDYFQNDIIPDPFPVKDGKIILSD